jgi:hypothetical protein
MNTEFETNEITVKDESTYQMPDKILLYVDLKPNLPWFGQKYPLTVRNKMGIWEIHTHVNAKLKRRWTVIYNKKAQIGGEYYALKHAKDAAKEDYTLRKYEMFRPIELPVLVMPDYDSEYDQGYMACLRDLTRSVNETKSAYGRELRERKMKRINNNENEDTP